MKRFSLILAIVMVAAATVAAPNAVAAATDVQLSEIMYHPASDDDREEFLELRNLGATPVDLTGWCVDGISFCFAPGATIAANGYVVLSPDAAVYTATYGGAPFATYSGGLKNGGETVTLLDAASNTIDEVSYDDAALWAITPDEGGPSLERISMTSNADDPWNWAAATNAAGHTVGAVNSVDAASTPPSLPNVSAIPASPGPGQALVVEIDAVNVAAAPTLRYRIDFGAEQSITMASIGGVRYRATIPGQSAASLIRYRVTSTGSFDHSNPRTDDSRLYLGVVVTDPALQADLPVLEWYIEDDDYDDMLENHRFDNVEFPAVIAYDGVVHDGVMVRVRGDSSRDLPKASINVVFPKNHLFDMPGLLSNEVDRFAMNAQAQTYQDPIALPAAWRFQTAAADTNRDYVSLHVRKNAEFQGLYGYVESTDDKWRERIGLDDIELYKPNRPWDLHRPIEERYDKENPDDGDFTNLLTMLDVVASGDHDDLFDTFDIPQMVNFAAIETLLRSEGGSSKNFLIGLNPDTGRWMGFIWDVNNTFKCGCDFVPPLTNQILAALIADPEFRQMHDRRLRTLLDEYLYTGVWEQYFNDVFAEIDTTRALDHALWGNGTAQGALDDMLERLHDEFEPFYIDAPPIPPSASGATPIVISEIHADPAAGDDAEFLELTNTSTTESVDLSRWVLGGGIDQVVPSGTVLLPGQAAVFVKDSPVFLAESGNGLTVLGTYGGKLASGGELVTLSTEAGVLVDSVDWSGPGFPTTNASASLELKALNLDNAVGANWQRSANAGGTPAAPNSVGADNPPDTATIAPVEGATVQGPTVVLSGTATDDNAVGAVAVLVLDTGAGQLLHRDGSYGGFTAEAFLISTLASPNAATTNWSLSVDLAAGNYETFAVAIDTAFQFDPTAAAVGFDVQVDVADPEGFVTFPVGVDQVVDSPVVITGEATDDVAVDRVEVAIRNRDTGLWLNPGGVFGSWNKFAAVVTGPVNDVDWTFEAVLPAGRFEVRTFVWDTAGRSDPTPAKVKFVAQVDVADPEGFVTFPVGVDQVVDSPVVITGEATDDVAVDRVEVAIRNRDTGLWLNPGGVFGSWNKFAAVVTGPVNDVDWTFEAVLPAGRFEVRTFVWDTAGRSDATPAKVKFLVS